MVKKLIKKLSKLLSKMFSAQWSLKIMQTLKDHTQTCSKREPTFIITESKKDH